ncbi:putative bifunctional diguanylate cyclase/phosphodiesterase [Litoribacillus peritrichatus]|uniref:GGDEF domain-containing response regulator n=1 Tax=Litoribacillus peritrichatus TaxID=718191 RepID=A0ABP7MFL2_9GAMM
MDILIVDDDQVDRALVIRTIKKSNLNVNITEAITVDEGLRCYAKQHFDIVLLDYRMPERDGIEMMMEIRNEPRSNDTAIVMMSASEDEALAVECIRAGAQDFITKSEITDTRLRRALLHASTRFDLEKQLFETFQKVKSLAETDALTGLSNRYLFDESLKQALANNRRNKSKLALLLFDLDDFKSVNDTYGHDVGDILLNKIVSRIKGCLRGNELFSRLGGDEFAITLTSLESPENASLVARRILRVLQKPVEIESVTINTSASIGIALCSEYQRTSDDLFKFADIAMYRAKKQGKGQVCFFEPKMQELFHSRLKTETELKQAINKNQLQLHYQPIINPTDAHQVLGFEALVRWKVTNTIRLPEQFLEIAEETHQIIDIDRWVISEALSQQARWNSSARTPPLTMAINVSASHLADSSIVEHVKACLKEHNTIPSSVSIEFTEAALIKNAKSTKAVLKALNELGVKLSLDDFGTGLSSLTQLQDFPLSVLKIDRSLLSDLNDQKTTLIESIVSMASILKLDIVAEGIETDEHQALCQKLKIQQAQGYYFSKPATTKDIESKFINQSDV